MPLLPAGGLGGAIPSSDPFETGFTTGQRNIFRQAFRSAPTLRSKKSSTSRKSTTLKYTFDVYNLTNTTSFDVPGNEVSQNQYYNAFPEAGTTPAPTGCAADGSQTNSSFYNCPGGLGIVTHTIGSPRQIQMSLAFSF